MDISSRLIGFQNSGQVLQPTLKLYKKSREPYLAYSLLSALATTSGSLRGSQRWDVSALVGCLGWKEPPKKKTKKYKKKKKHFFFF